MTNAYDPLVWEGELNELPLILDRQVLYRFKVAGVPVEAFAYLRSDSDRLVVSGQDALNQTRPPLPFFYRWSWYSDLPMSFITINDPTMHRHEHLVGGWYQFGPDGFAIETFSDLISKIVAMKGIKEDDIVLYGASAGGFWALMSGAHFPKAAVVVEIPQTDMFEYPVPHHRRALLSTCYPSLDESEIRSSFGHKLRVVDYYRKMGRVPSRIFYHQNILDPLHIQSQMKPFFREMADLVGEDEALTPTRLDARFYKRVIHRGGHCPMDKPESLEAILEPFGAIEPQAVPTASQISVDVPCRSDEDDQPAIPLRQKLLTKLRNGLGM